MKAVTCAMLLLCTVTHQPATGPVDGWPLFAGVRFTEKYVKEYDAYFLFPFFDTKIRACQGKEIMLKGHYMPIDTEDGAILLSKFPYAQCFFCGGAGPETAAEIYFKTKAPRLKADQVIRVKGTLQLNDRDIEHMNFILRDAEIL